MGKKLIEVGLPLEAINRAAAHEKTVKIGKPTSVHLWWARRPLAACRAVLFASLVDDPSSDPARFPDTELQERERVRLYGLLGRVLAWDNLRDAEALRAVRDEISRATRGNPPPVLDPFCGGGSIPIEVQRLGLQVEASDLNPVAVLVTKAVVEIPARFADLPPVHPEAAGRVTHGAVWRGAFGLAEDVRRYGAWVREAATNRLSHLYPSVRGSNGRVTPVIAWIWARQVTCPNPGCRGSTPLIHSFWLSRKAGKRVWIEPQVDAAAKHVRFNIVRGETEEPPSGTVSRTGARCIFCSSPIPLEHVRSEGRARRLGAQMIAIAAEGERGRRYLAPEPEHTAAAAHAASAWVPETSLPEAALGFRIQRYGFSRHAELFTARQLQALGTISDLIGEAHARVLADAKASGLAAGVPLHEGGQTALARADAVATYLGLALSRTTDWNNSFGRWEPNAQVPQQLFGQQTVSMVWDYTECNPLSESTGSFYASVENVARSLAATPSSGARRVRVRQRDATTLTDLRGCLVCTDPPYYDNIGYADLSDFFYVWLRRTVGKYFPDLFSTILTPKEQELIAAPDRFDGDQHSADEHFERGLRRAFERMRVASHSEYPVVFFYAFKQADTDADGDGATVMASTGWETMLEGLIDSGFQVTGTWPVRTEGVSRVRAHDSNVLASSIVLVCRPRPASAPLATRREFTGALRAALPVALGHLQRAAIAPVDLAQASIGPGIRVFSSFARVLEADGSAMPVRAALELINQELDAFLAAQEGELDGESRWAIAWFEQYGLDEGPFGVAETLSKAKNTSIQRMHESGIALSRAGKVQLAPPPVFDEDWDPATVDRCTVWECTQRLISAMESGGVDAAARIAARLGSGQGENSRSLAYRLYAICDRKKWSERAFPYNALVSEWPSIAERSARFATQERLGV